MKNKKRIAWIVLNIVGLILFFLIFGFMALDFYQGQIPFTTWVVTEPYSFYDLIFKISSNTFSSILTIIFILLVMFAIWSITAFTLHVCGIHKGNIYKYLNKKVSKLFSIIFAILLFALILYLIIIASKMSDGISYPNILFSGFHSVIISVVVLCVTQVAGTFMLRLQDGK